MRDPATPAESPDARYAALRERQLKMLGELAEIGLELARGIEAESKRPGADPYAAMLAYARVARAVRQTILLQSRIIDGPEAERAKAGKSKTLTPADRAAEVKQRILAILDRAIDSGPEAPERAERLRVEAAERLDDEANLLDRPVVEIVADICRALGLRPDWSGLAADVNAAEDVARGDDGGPFEVMWLDSEGWPTPAGDSS
jgi:hypothetical protein